MLLQFVLLAALGAACAGCSAPSINTALAADNPANPDAASVPFIRPVDVLAEGAAPQTSIPSTAMHMAGGSMPTMDMSGGMAGMGHSSMAGISPSSPGNDAAMLGMKMAQATPPGAGQANAVGTVNAVDTAKHSVNVTHQPIKALGWPSMTMDFPVASSVDLSTTKPGARIAFTLGRPDADGNRQVVQIKPMPGSAASQSGMRRVDHGSMPGMTMPGDPQ
jgi:Cu(I)/Ag(I) efflux system protein CusF